MPLTFFACCLISMFAETVLADPFDHEWCRYKTGEFDLVTDVAATDIQDIVRRMALFRLSVSEYIGDEAPETKLPLKIFIFKSRQDFRVTVKAGVFAGFMHATMNVNHLVFGPQRGSRYLGENALHEYTHYLVRDRVDVSYPLWYEEGLANFLSTLAFTDNQVLIGAYPSKARVQKTLSNTSLRLAQVVDTRHVADWRHDRLSTFYDWSWALVHYLNFGPDASERQQQLAVYLSDTNRSFEQAFGTKPRRLERALKRHLRGSLPNRLEPLSAPANSSIVESRCLSDSERNFELAITMMKHNPTGAIEVLKNLLDENYAPVETLVALSNAYSQIEEAATSLQYAEAALERDSTRVSAKIQLAIVLTGDCVYNREPECYEIWQKAIPLLRSAMRIDPQRYDAIFYLGLAYLHSGQAGDAINYLRVAYTKVPWSPRINFYLGEGYRLIGDRRAKLHLINARNWASSDVWRHMAELALEKLD
ncbi:MAG: hypothetical protein O7F71_15030 [Gammaproteobacteria bacterium]|nr:hypothetical protein [Gammaproteobacteria bacterium]